MSQQQQQQQQPPGAAHINARVAQGISGLFGQSLLADCQLVFVQERRPPGLGKRPHGGHGGGGQRYGEPLPAHSFVLRFASDKIAAQLALPAASATSSAPETPSQARKKVCKCATAATADATAATSSAAATAATDAAAKTPLPEMELMVGGEEELPAARAAIQFAYTGRVEAGGGVRKALQVRRQAASLQLEGCVEACMAAVREQLLLAAAGGGGAGAGAAAAAGAGAAAAAAAAAGTSTSTAGDAGAADVVPPPPAVLELYSCSEVWPDPAEDAAFAALLTEAKRRLVAHFGDALAVLNSQRLFEQMRALPAEGMKVLLESNDFGTDNESSVVLVLAEWMAVNYCRKDEDTRKQLCGLLRLSQCSRAYLTRVLPALAARHEAGPYSAGGWLPISRDDATCLLAYSTATEQERRAMTGEDRVWGLSAAMAHWPEHWLSSQRRRQCLPAEGRTMSFSASLAEMVKAFGGLKSGDPRWLRLNLGPGSRLGNQHFGAQGLEWSLSVAWASGDAAAGVYVMLHLPTALTASSPAITAAAKANKLLDGAVAAVPRLRLSVCGADGQQAWSRPLGGDVFFMQTGFGWGHSTALELREEPAADQPAEGAAASGPNTGGGSTSGVAARWAGYLQGGTRLAGSVTLLPPM